MTILLGEDIHNANLALEEKQDIETLSRKIMRVRENLVTRVNPVDANEDTFSKLNDKSIKLAEMNQAFASQKTVSGAANHLIQLSDMFCSKATNETVDNCLKMADAILTTGNKYLNMGAK